jgi:hypothetical protein
VLSTQKSQEAQAQLRLHNKTSIYNLILSAAQMEKLALQASTRAEQYAENQFLGMPTYSQLTSEFNSPIISNPVKTFLNGSQKKSLQKSNAGRFFQRSGKGSLLFGFCKFIFHWPLKVFFCCGVKIRLRNLRGFGLFCKSIYFRIREVC